MSFYRSIIVYYFQIGHIQLSIINHQGNNSRMTDAGMTAGLETYPGATLVDMTADDHTPLSAAYAETAAAAHGDAADGAGDDHAFVDAQDAEDDHGVDAGELAGGETTLMGETGVVEMGDDETTAVFGRRCSLSWSLQQEEMLGTVVPMSTWVEHHLCRLSEVLKQSPRLAVMGIRQLVLLVGRKRGLEIQR